MAETPSVELEEVEVYTVERRSEYTFLQPTMYDYRLSFNQDTSDNAGNDAVCAVKIENLNCEDEYPVELTREAAIDMAKAILAEAGESFFDYELDNWRQQGSRI